MYTLPIRESLIKIAPSFMGLIAAAANRARVGHFLTWPIIGLRLISYYRYIVTYNAISHGYKDCWRCKSKFNFFYVIKKSRLY